MLAHLMFVPFRTLDEGWMQRSEKAVVVVAGSGLGLGFGLGLGSGSGL